MSREIKFRAKGYRTEEWQYGNLLYDDSLEDDVVFIQTRNGISFACKKGTEGQFTGLKDKNNIDIYEGDILCWSQYEGKKHQTRWVVEWNNARAGWSDWSPREQAEVIGNIYETPQLLENDQEKIVN